MTTILVCRLVINLRTQQSRASGGVDTPQSTNGRHTLGSGLTNLTSLVAVSAFFNPEIEGPRGGREVHLVHRPPFRLEGESSASSVTGG